MGGARHAEPGFSPLDDELALVSGSLTPTLDEHVVRLGTSLPFAGASKEIEAFRRVSVSLSTVRRHTLKAGTACLNALERQVERLETDAPPPSLGPERLVFSVDGAMVPLLKGEWAEVKTLAIGAVNGTREDGTVRTEEWSYFSRLIDAEAFTQAALGETDRRGLTPAKRVAAVTDGAEWIQGFIDYHRPDAVRILDFPHAAQRVSDLCVCLGEGPELLSQRLRRLKEEGPCADLLEWRTAFESSKPLVEGMREPLFYLEKRRSQLDYPTFQRDGWPIGSGSVESANKLVVQARLKGAGMHWKRENVNPMLALRSVLCSDRWDETWKEIGEVFRLPNPRNRASKGEAHSPSDLLVLSSPPLLLADQDLSPPPNSTRKPVTPHPWKRFRNPSVGYFSSSSKL